MLPEFRTLPIRDLKDQFIVWHEQPGRPTSLGRIVPNYRTGSGYVIERSNYPVRLYNHDTVESATNELIWAYKAHTERRAELARMTVEGTILTRRLFCRA